MIQHVSLTTPTSWERERGKLSLSHLGFLSPPHSLKPAAVLLLDYTHGFTLAFIPVLCVMVRHVCPSSFHYRRRAGTLCLLL